MYLSQNVTLTPQLLQSIRLLQLSALELEQEVQAALESNLMLESEEEAAEREIEPADFEPTATPIETHAGDLAATDSLEAAVSGCDASAIDKVEADFDWSSAESWSGGEPGGGGSFDADGDGEPIEARRAAAPIEDARIAALAQLELMIDTPRQRQLVTELIERVDDNGYLEQSLDQILSALPPEWAVELAELEAALTLLQGVEPTGFAARDLRECLLLQLEALPPGIAGRNLAERIVDGHLPKLAARDFAVLRAELAVNDDQLYRARLLIRTLDPKPGASRIEPAQAVVPDLMVAGTEGGWRVELNPVSLPRLRLNRQYEQIVSRPGAERGLRDQLQAARWLVRGLEMRHETLLKTARVVFERQCEFLRAGEEGMRPLTLREVAEAIGMHESTVCRVTTNKFVQTPWGVYPMKAFFPSQIQGAESDTSGTAVKAMIRRIVDGEKVSQPLCDGDIAGILARGGIRVARRTVAKYREAMKIAPAKERLAAVTRPRLQMTG
jgi:RNA polymerase sigma-54 factor